MPAMMFEDPVTGEYHKLFGTGPKGAQGDPGPDGRPGGTYLASQWNFNPTNTPPPPSGTLRIDTDDVATATTVWIHYIDRANIDRSVGLRLGAVGDTILLQSPQARAEWVITSVGDTGSYVVFGVSTIAFDGTVPNGGATTNLYLFAQVKGDAGVPGIVVVEHGADGTVARPDAPVVYWVGSAVPDNGLPYDFWKDS